MSVPYTTLDVVKRVVNEKTAGTKITPLESLVGLTPEAEIRGFRLGDESTGPVYKIRETARAENILEVIPYPEGTNIWEWNAFIDEWNRLVTTYAEQFKGRTYQGHIRISGFPPAIATFEWVVVATVLENNSAKLDIYSLDEEPYHWEIGTKIGTETNYNPQAFITCSDTFAQRQKWVTKELRYKVEQGDVHQVWQPEFIHTSVDEAAVLEFTLTPESIYYICGTLIVNGMQYAVTIYGSNFHLTITGFRKTQIEQTGTEILTGENFRKELTNTLYDYANLGKISYGTTNNISMTYEYEEEGESPITKRTYRLKFWSSPPQEGTSGIAQNVNACIMLHQKVQGVN